jgi:hypothetical protein
LNVREDGTYVFAGPVGDAPAPLVALQDIAFWVRHALDNPENTSGKDLEIASDVFTWEELVTTFTKVTGKKAIYKRVTMDEFFDLFINADLQAATQNVRPTGSWRKAIGGIWALLRDEVIKRDFDWIRSVHPNSLTLEGWMRETQYDGSYQPLLKLVGQFLFPRCPVTLERENSFQHDFFSEDQNMSMYPNFEKCKEL